MRSSMQCFSTTYLCLGRRVCLCDPDFCSQSYLDLPLLTHLLQFNTKAFPTQARNIVSHVCLALL